VLANHLPAHVGFWHLLSAVLDQNRLRVFDRWDGDFDDLIKKSGLANHELRF